MRSATVKASMVTHLAFNTKVPQQDNAGWRHNEPVRAVWGPRVAEAHRDTEALLE
jgi:hypothetical protein